MVVNQVTWSEDFYRNWVDWRYARVFTEIAMGDWLEDLVWC